MKETSRFATILAVIASFGAPLSAAAAGGIDKSFALFYRDVIVGSVNYFLAPILIATAFITFLWGVYKYFILGADNETDRATGRQFILWGVIGFVVIFSVWGLVAIVSGTFGFAPNSPGNLAPPPPLIK